MARMYEPPESIPPQFHCDWLSQEDVLASAARRGFDEIIRISTRFGFAVRDGNEWERHDHVCFGGMPDAISLAEVDIYFSDGSVLKAILGHDLVEAADTALQVYNLATEEGARLAELKDCIDTTYMDLSVIEDMRVRSSSHLSAPDTHDIVYRMPCDDDWLWQAPLRFMRPEKCRLALLKIAGAASDKTGFASVQTYCDLPRHVLERAFGEYALYLRPSGITAVMAGREFDHDLGGYKKGPAVVCMLYGKNRHMRIELGDDFIKARFVMRQLLSLQGGLQPIDKSKLIYVHPARFKAANIYPDNSPAPPSANDNRTAYLHFKDHARPLAISFKTDEAASAACAFMNVAAAEARRPRLVKRHAGNVVLFSGARGTVPP